MKDKDLISQYKSDFALWLKEYLKQNPDYPPIWENMLSEISKGRKLRTFPFGSRSYMNPPKEIYDIKDFYIDKIRRDMIDERKRRDK